MLSLRRARSIETEAGAKKEFKVPHTLVIISFSHRCRSNMDITSWDV